MDVFVATIKAHLRPGCNGYVQPYARKPVVIDIGMLRHFGARAQTHQSRTTPHDAKTGEYLAQVGRISEVRRRQYDTVDIVVLAAVYAEQPD